MGWLTTEQLMREIILDGASWKDGDDVYDAFFAAVGAPSWHGRNFNALRDSIEAGSINDIEVPYCLAIRNYNLIGPGAKNFVEDFIDLIQKIRARGCPVEIKIDSVGRGAE
jgi:RNAse (barnase) inhibitor barstar